MLYIFICICTEIVFVKKCNPHLLLFLLLFRATFLHSRSIKIQIHFPPNQQQINAFLLQLILLFILLLLLFMRLMMMMHLTLLNAFLWYISSFLFCHMYGWDHWARKCTFMQIYAAAANKGISWMLSCNHRHYLSSCTKIIETKKIFIVLSM